MGELPKMWTLTFRRYFFGKVLLSKPGKHCLAQSRVHTPYWQKSLYVYFGSQTHLCFQKHLLLLAGIKMHRSTLWI